MSASAARAALAGAAAGALLAAGPLAGAGEAGSAPVVQEMVVGSAGQVLAPAREVTAAATLVRVGGRSCAVAAGTPLAVLADARAAGGPGFAVRDYGRCGASPADSGQLFVYSLGGERNRGQSGWDYKVDGVAGSTGAADPSGPRGDGRRLRGGDQVLWFWCHPSGSGCQRTLELSSPSGPLARGGTVTVAVYGADNEGRLAYVRGALVSLAGRTARSDSFGHATLALPGRGGLYAVSASRPGMAPSFPGTIAVR